MMDKINPDLKPGESKFLKRFEGIYGSEKPKDYDEAKERIGSTIKKISEEIAALPEIQREQLSHSNINISQSTNVLARAIQIAIDEGVEKGLEFIKKTNNPFLIDAFHDLLIGHFVDLILNKNKK